MGPGPMTMAMGACEAVGSTVAVGATVPVDVGSGVEPGVAVDRLAGFEVGFCVGFGFVDRGLAVGFGVGFGLAVGFGVGFGVGLGVAGGVTTIVPGETLDSVTVFAPLPDPLVAEKLNVCEPAASLRFTVNVTPVFQLVPEAVMGSAPTPEMSTTTLDAAQPAVSSNRTENVNVVVGLPLPGEALPAERLG